jgi:N-acetyltransferase
VKTIQNHSFKTFDLQPRLETQDLLLVPIEEKDFLPLYEVAADPKIWEQHPNPLRYQKDVFQNYFDGAIASNGALLIKNSQTGEIMGSSRYYDFETEFSQIKIGYTFLACKFWGGKYNSILKRMMLNHAFQFVDTVLFEIGSGNIRSQKAMERIGGKKISESEVAYYGEKPTLNFVYAISKSEFEY